MRQGDEILEGILGHLRENFPGQDFEADTNLEGLLVESLTMMELIIFMEDAFGLRFTRADLDPEHFVQPQRIVNLVLRKQAS